MTLVEQLKQHVANEALDYKAILDLCENQMMSIKFFGICWESMIRDENLEIGKLYKGGNAIYFHCHPHELVLSWQEKMNHMLIFSPSAYATCAYNSFWWVCIISLVDITAGDVINLGFMHPHGPWKTFNYHQNRDSCYVLVEFFLKDINFYYIYWEILHLANFSNNKLLYIVVLLLPFAKCFISANECLIRKAKTWQYSYFWL